MFLLKLNLRFSGKDHRRQSYILIMHSISNRNFEIHIFALLTFRRKIPGCYRHYSHFRTQAKVWSRGFFGPEMHEDTKRYVASCPECQRTENISQRNFMPLTYNLQIDIFDVWGIDFMGPFKNSFGF
jgi:hypothetical protein